MNCFLLITVFKHHPAQKNAFVHSLLVIRLWQLTLTFRQRHIKPFCLSPAKYHSKKAVFWGVQEFPFTLKTHIANRDMEMVAYISYTELFGFFLPKQKRREASRATPEGDGCRSRGCERGPCKGETSYHQIMIHQAYRSSHPKLAILHVGKLLSQYILVILKGWNLASEHIFFSNVLLLEHAKCQLPIMYKL